MNPKIVNHQHSKEGATMTCDISYCWIFFLGSSNHSSDRNARCLLFCSFEGKDSRSPYGRKTSLGSSILMETTEAFSSGLLGDSFDAWRRWDGKIEIKGSDSPNIFEPWMAFLVRCFQSRKGKHLEIHLGNEKALVT